MTLHARSWRTAALVALGLVLAHAGCSSDDDRDKRVRQEETEEDEAADTDRLGGPPLPRPAPVEDVAAPNDDDEARKLVYLVSKDEQLYSFDPRKPGRAAYKLVGKLQCKTYATPQSMAVDRSGWAWVFYDSRELFKVNVRDASCMPAMPYTHPSGNPQLGMGFTAVSPGSSQEQLYVLSPAFGLATISTQSLNVSRTGKLTGGAELTGGGDGRLFHYAAWQRQLSEIDLGDFSLKPVHTFKSLQNVNAWAFARYAGRFYVFTSNGFGPSKTTEFDPKTQIESVRDEDIGIIVVGAGQSTLAPPPDTSGDISGDFPPPSNTGQN
ncbi:MAG: hypothetical protein HOW73_49785 [Polyangiaceae bacterium]|nr:hypothetical protein [Polyangiaceae bacterium]